MLVLEIEVLGWRPVARYVLALVGVSAEIGGTELALMLAMLWARSSTSLMRENERKYCQEMKFSK